MAHDVQSVSVSKRCQFRRNSPVTFFCRRAIELAAPALMGLLLNQSVFASLLAQVWGRRSGERRMVKHGGDARVPASNVDATSRPVPVNVPFRIKQSSYNKVDGVHRWEQRSSTSDFVISGRSQTTPPKVR